MSNQVVLINQVTGPLFIDIANEYVKKYDNVVLITGTIEATYAEIDDQGDNEYNILLSKQALEDDVTLYKTIAHECIHIKQYFTEELVHVNQYRTMFKNKVYDHFCTPYETRPWEVEAYHLEEELYECSDLRA